MADPVPAPTVDLDAELAAVARAWDEALADDCWAEGLALRRVVSAALAELSVLRAREAQVRELHACALAETPYENQTGDDGEGCAHCAVPWPCPTVAVLDGTTGSGKTG